jgi:hypothetical protein
LYLAQVQSASSRESIVVRLWSQINCLSIDIAIGAMGACFLFARLFQVTLRPQAYLALGALVWIIYTVDHLADAAQEQAVPPTARHRFHWKYRNELTIAVLIAGFFVGLLVFMVRTQVLMAGIGVGFFVAFYLVVQRRLAQLKELMAALLYTLGVSIGPWSLMVRPLTAPEAVTLIAFVITAWANLLICSYYDYGADSSSNQRSFSTRFGLTVTRRLLFGLFACNLGVLVWLVGIPGSIRATAGVLLIMNATLFLVVTAPSYFSQSERHRLFADLAFLFPLVSLFIDGSEWV